MGPNAVIANLGMLMYCTEYKAKRLTREDIEANEKARPLLKYGMDSQRYAVNDQGLMLMVTDAGASVRHLRRKLIRAWATRKKHAEWAVVMEQGAFSLICIMSSHPKARRLRDAMRRFRDVAFEAVVFPELNDLLDAGE